MFKTKNNLQYELGKLVQTAQILLTVSSEVHGNKAMATDISYEISRLIRNMTQDHHFNPTTDQMKVIAKVILAIGEGYVPE